MIGRNRPEGSGLAARRSPRGAGRTRSFAGSERPACRSCRFRSRSSCLQAGSRARARARPRALPRTDSRSAVSGHHRAPATLDLPGGGGERAGDRGSALQDRTLRWKRSRGAPGGLGALVLTGMSSDLALDDGLRILRAWSGQGARELPVFAQWCSERLSWTDKLAHHASMVMDILAQAYSRTGPPAAMAVSPRRARSELLAVTKCFGSRQPLRPRDPAASYILR